MARNPPIVTSMHRRALGVADQPVRRARGAAVERSRRRDAERCRARAARDPAASRAAPARATRIAGAAETAADARDCGLSPAVSSTGCSLAALVSARPSGSARCVPGASSAGDAASGSNSGAAVVPISRQPPGVSRGYAPVNSAREAHRAARDARARRRQPGHVEGPVRAHEVAEPGREAGERDRPLAPRRAAGRARRGSRPAARRSRRGRRRRRRCRARRPRGSGWARMRHPSSPRTTQARAAASDSVRGSTRTSTVRAAGTSRRLRRDGMPRARRAARARRRASRPPAGSPGRPSAGSAAARAHHGARTSMPSASSAARTARAIATASGESPCTQRDAASTRDERAVDRLDHALADEAHRAGGDLRRVVEERAGLAARRRASRRPGSRGRGTPRARSGSPAAARGALDLAAQAEHGERATEPVGERRDRGDDRVRLRGIRRDRVVERAVRLDVADVGAGVHERGELRGDGLR